MVLFSDGAMEWTLVHGSEIRVGARTQMLERKLLTDKTNIL